MTRFRNTAKMIFFALIPAFVLFLSLETYTRLTSYYRTGESRFLYWGTQEAINIDRRSNEANTAKHLVSPHTPGFIQVNRYGLRGRNFHIQKPKDTIRILALGGSSTWGTGTPDGKTWPELLEKHLIRNVPGQRFEVVNGGVPGYTVASATSLLTGPLFKGFMGDILILYAGYNDLMSKISQEFTIHRCEEKGVPWKYRLLDFLSTKSLFFLIAREKFVFLFPDEARNYMNSFWQDKYKCEEKLKRKKISESISIFKQEARSGLKGFQRDVLNLRKAAAERGLRMIFVRQAFRPKGGALFNFLPALWAAADKVLTPWNVPVFDMNEYFKKRATDGKSPHVRLMRDEIHPTLEGNKVIAKAMADSLLNLGWVNPIE